MVAVAAILSAQRPIALLWEHKEIFKHKEQGVMTAGVAFLKVISSTSLPCIHFVYMISIFDYLVKCTANLTWAWFHVKESVFCQTWCIPWGAALFLLNKDAQTISQAHASCTPKHHFCFLAVTQYRENMVMAFANELIQYIIISTTLEIYANIWKDR